MAKLPYEEIARLYPSEELLRVTPNSIGTRTELEAVLAEVREQGYARSQEESEEGVSSIAVALHSTRSPRPAVNAAVPTSRTSDQVKRDILKRLTAAAEELDHLLLWARWPGDDAHGRAAGRFLAADGRFAAASPQTTTALSDSGANNSSGS